MTAPAIQAAPNGEIIITLHGEPQGKGRPRFSLVTPASGKSFTSVYTPKETRAYERALAMAGKTAMRRFRRLPLQGPLDVVVLAVMSVPSSWSKKKRDAALTGVVRPTVTPDWDNIGKMVDGLNGIAWIDDKQIVRGTVVKSYGEYPRLEVRIKESDPGNSGVP